MIEEKIAKILEKQKQIKKELKENAISFLECEESLRNLAGEFEKILQEDTLTELTEPTQLNKIECKCGSFAKYKDLQTKRLRTGRTDIKIKRRHYFCPKCKTSYYPLDEKYGLKDIREFSPLMISIMAFLASKMSYAESQQTMKEILNIKISTTAVQNQSEKFGKEILEHKFDYIAAENKDEILRMILLLDGGMIHTGCQEYKEARLGVVIKYTAKSGINVHKFPACDNAENFCRDFDIFCRMHGSSACKHIAVVGDGAAWIDNFQATYYWEAIRIIDYFHAKEYIVKALKEIYGEEWEKQTKSDYILGLLENGEALEIAEELKKVYLANTKTDEVFKAMRYFEKHWEKMRYKEYEKQGYPIGSGEVEGGIRNVIHDRMGKSRSTWTICDANAIMILRAYIINGYWQFIKQKRFQMVCKNR